MRMFTTSLILTALLGLTACDPTGPAADIGDNIDQVKDNTATEPAPSVESTDTVESTNSPANSELEQPLRPVREINGDNSSATDQTDNLRPNVNNTARRPATTSHDAATPHDATAPPTEVIEEQKQQLEEASKAASAEADQKLHEILEETSGEP